MTYMGADFDWGALWGAVGTLVTTTGGVIQTQQLSDVELAKLRAKGSNAGSSPSVNEPPNLTPYIAAGGAVLGLVIIVALLKR